MGFFQNLMNHSFTYSIVIMSLIKSVGLDLVNYYRLVLSANKIGLDLFLTKSAKSFI
jgi:hypothetical protein